MGAFRPTGDDVFGGMPRRHYRCINADPAWAYLAYSGKADGQRSAGSHYATQSLEDICGLPVGDLAHPEGCHLFLWATWPNLAEAFKVAEAWGFTYSASGFVWLKTQAKFQGRYLDVQTDLPIGLGHTTRKNTEPVLLFRRGEPRRGEPRRKSKAVREVFIGPEPDDLELSLDGLAGADWPVLAAPRARHSEKPFEIFRRIESYCDGPYLEMNSRRTQPGWDAWGDEAGRFDDGRLGRPTKVLSPDALPLFGRAG